jgi:hypothetical protein
MRRRHSPEIAMPKHQALFAVLSLLFVATCAFAQAPEASSERTTWDHNGSAMYLIAKGSSRELFYEKPRPGMLEAGAKPGSLLFRGEVSNGQYSGTAYVFNLQCGQVPFNVKGAILDNGERIVLTGQAPRIGRNCQAYGAYSTTLEFKLLQPAATSAPPEPQNEDQTKAEPRLAAANTANTPSPPGPATIDFASSTKEAKGDIASTVSDAPVPDDNPNDKIVHSDFDNYVSAAAVMIVVAASLFFWARQKLKQLFWRNRGLY